MPNWCSNKLEVKGKGFVVKHFIQENFKTNKYDDEFKYELDFEKFNPTPIDDKTGEIIENWYTWRLENWGCKWSPAGMDQIVHLSVDDNGEISEYNYHTEIMFTEDLINNLNEEGDVKLELECYFDTPWGPPEKIFDDWYGSYKSTGMELSLKFFEPGCEILGEMWFNGEEVGELYPDSDSVEYYEYLLNNGWETVGGLIDYYVYFKLEDMHDNKDVLEKLVDKIYEECKKMTNKQIAMLIHDIDNQWIEWNKKGEENEPSEK